MKTKRMIIAAVVLQALVPAASAQKQIKETFADVEKYSGVTKTGEQTTSNVDANGINVESSVVTIRVKGRDYYRAVFDKVKDAFDKEGKNASWAVVETGPEGMGVDSATIHDLGFDRKLWSVWRENAEPVLVGNMKNSSYRLQNFDDKKHPDYRTCIAAEWSNADTPDVYTARLVYVYGQQPPGSSGIAEAKSLNLMRTASLIDGLPDDLMDRLKGQTKLPDSLFVRSLDSLFNRSSKNVAIGSFRLDIPTDIPFDGNMDSWMALVMQRGVSKLSNADWHRFFGLLTQQMMDKGNKESKEDLVVSAGLILDLCKNAPLDDDERKVAANRLLQVSEYFDDDKNQYVFDMIELARKKVEKQK